MTNFLRFGLWLGVCVAAVVPVRAQITGDPATVLHRFSGPDGSDPTAALTQGSDGNFYGTTETGGANNKGTIFELTSAGVLTTLRSFNGEDGSRPNTPLIEGSDGSLYGTTLAGGSNDTGSGGGGTIFQLTSKRELKTLYSFNLAGESPVSLRRSGDGNFYGTASGYGRGTVFRLTPAGVFTILQPFDHSVGPVVLGRDGSLFGTVINSGTLHPGFVFQINPAGVLSVIHVFAASDYVQPKLQFQGADGAFYGTTGVRSSLGSGEVFRVTASGAFSVVSNVGYLPYDQSLDGPLIQARDGNFYGLESLTNDLDNGGVSIYFELFQLTPAGVFTNIHGFPGSAPASLIQGKDGGLYVTSFRTNGGTIMRLDLVAETVSVAVVGSTNIKPGGPVSRLVFSRTSADLSRDLSVGFDFFGSAKNGTNFTAPDGQPLPKRVTIPAGQATAELDLKAVADPAQTGDLSLDVSLLQISTENYLLSDSRYVMLTVQK